jgi:hypothetical protein
MWSSPGGAAPNEVRPIHRRGRPDDCRVEDESKGEHRESNYFFAGYFQDAGCLSALESAPER